MMNVAMALSVAAIYCSKRDSTGKDFWARVFLISGPASSHTKTIGTAFEISRHSSKIAAFNSFLVENINCFQHAASILN
jgi:hypothetical protein